MPFNDLLFMKNTRITINYVDITNNTTVETKELNLEYNREDNMDIFNLPFISNNSTINGYTDQNIQADLSNVNNPNAKLGISSITAYNNRDVITYYIAPTKTTGTIYINYVYNHQVIKQDKTTGILGTHFNSLISYPSGYQAANGSPDFSNLTYQSAPQYENVLLNETGD